mgnify:CR=1 FL=1
MSFERNSLKIYKNTTFLYVRLILIMGVTLYSSRVILEVLGVEDFGIFNVVGGIIVLLSFLNNAMTLSVNRFLAYEMGLSNSKALNKVFSTSVNIHAVIAVIALIIGETIGLWFVNNKLVIPADRLIAANWIYQFSILSFVFTVLRVPYNASVIAHENMKLYAYIGILEAILKLGIAFSLYILPGDKLIFYGILMALFTFIVTVFYYFYCRHKYEECIYHFVYDKKLSKVMLNYAGISTIGNMSSVVVDQGQNILLNLFFGPVVNAARSISYQISSALNSFVSNMYMAATPQITKAYAADDRDYLVKIVNQTSLIVMLFLSLLIVPVIFELPFAMRIWLGNNIPEGTVLFARLILVYMFIVNIGRPLLIAIQSSGQILKAHVYTGLNSLLNLPIAYVALKYFNIEAYNIFIIQILISVVYCIILLYLSQTQLSWNIKLFVRKVIIPGLSALGINFLMCGLAHSFFPYGFLRVLIVCMVSLLTMIAVSSIVMPQIITVIKNKLLK